MIYQWPNEPDGPKKTWVAELNKLTTPERITLLNCIIYGSGSKFAAGNLEKAGKDMLDSFCGLSHCYRKDIIRRLEDLWKRHPGSELNRVFKK